METRFSVAAVIFDLDGVLVDSMAAIRRYWVDWGRQRGIDRERVLATIHLPAGELVRMLAPDANPMVEAERASAGYEIEGIPAVTGSHELIALLPRDRWAIVTSGAREVARRRLAAAGLPVPRVLVAGEDAPRGKPDPGGYLLAADRLGFAPSSCLAIEDSPAGVMSARAAGMTVIALTTAASDDTAAPADGHIRSLRSLRVRIVEPAGIDVTITSGTASHLRPMTERDARAVASIHVRTWQVAYRGQLPDDFLERLSAEVDERAARWERFVAEAPERGWSQLVAEADDRVIGFITFGASNDEPRHQGVGEVYALYVDPAHWHHGHGRELLAAAVEGLGQRLFTEATLWVLATNTRARRFYQVAGWHPDGATKTDRLGDVALREVRYRVTLAASQGLGT